MRIDTKNFTVHEHTVYTRVYFDQHTRERSVPCPRTTFGDMQLFVIEGSGARLHQYKNRHWSWLYEYTYGDVRRGLKPVASNRVRVGVSEYINEQGVHTYHQSLEQFCNTMWHRGTKYRNIICGFDLAYELSKLAVEWTPAKKRFRGGFTYYLCVNADGSTNYRKCIHVKTTNNLTSFAFSNDKNTFEGQFLDLQQLARALTGKDYTFAEACHEFRCSDTSELTLTLITEFDKHPISRKYQNGNLSETRATSPASIAKSYLYQMGITRPKDKYVGPKEVLGYGMSAYHGGRTEVRIQRRIMPVPVVDFRSNYAGVFSLMRLQEVLCAEKIHATECEVPDIDPWCRDDWRKLNVLCEVEPDGELLPIDADFPRAHDDEHALALAYVHGGRLWFPLADLVASKLLCGRMPKVVRAYKVYGEGVQGDLTTVKLMGKVKIDPYTDDIFATVVRARVGADKRLSDFLKTMASAGASGIYAETHVTRSTEQRRIKRQKVRRIPAHTVYGPDGMCTVHSYTSENCADWNFPPIASFVTGGGRLLLAMLQAEVIARGGSYVWSDTDAMGITGLSCVREIQDKFQMLDPYEDGKDFLKLEPENAGDQLYTLAGTSKRHAEFNLNPLRIRKWTEHGVAQIVAPDGKDKVDGKRPWMHDVWEFNIRRELGEAQCLASYPYQPILRSEQATNPTLQKSLGCDPYATVEVDKGGWINTYGRFAQAYLGGNESKFDGPDADGVLSYKHIRVRDIQLVGKETVYDRGQPGTQPNLIRQCEAPGCMSTLTPRQRRWCGDACRKRAERVNKGSTI